MDKFFQYLMGMATGLCALAWGIPNPTATIIGLVGAIVAIAMASYSLGETVRDTKRSK